MAPIETVAIITCVVAGGIITLKKQLTGVCVDISYFCFQLFFRVTAAWASFVPKSVELRLGNDNKVVRAHYLEYGATTTSSKSSSGRQDILVVPGFTAEANAMVKLVSTMNLPPETRVCIMELPLHGKNVENFDGKNCFPEPQDIVDYTFAFLKAVGLGKENGAKIPLSIVGFSLGGGVCFEMLAQQPPETYRKVILLAPALKDTIDDNFKKVIEDDPRKVHGWETLEQCEDFITKTGGGFYPNKIPRVVLVGMHRQRELTYAEKDKSFFTNYYRGFHGIEFGSKISDDDERQKLARCKTPVLVACGDRDNSISSEKCKNLFKDIDDNYFSFHEISDTGHVGGPANMKVMTMIFEIFGPVAGDFLFR